MGIYDIAVVGAGAAGTMAAICASQARKDVVLIERNNSIGKKLLLTGKGRCNISNAASIDIFIEKFGKQGKFLRSAFSAFFNHDLIDFFKTRGIGLKTERQSRIFPITDKASSVIDVLKKSLLDNKVSILYNARLLDVKRKSDFFQLELAGKDKICAKRLILATGGTSYKATGSSGDGFRIAKKLGHAIIPLKPALVPLKTKEAWVKKLQGLSLKNVRIALKCDSKKIVSEVGELIFTHFGLSGPLILDLSGKVVSMLEKDKQIRLFIDLKPGLKPEQLQRRLLNEFKTTGSTKLKNILKSLLPQRLISVFIDLSNLDGEKKANQIGREERNTIANLLKGVPLTITGFLHIEEAMVTNGGVSTKQINPRTMESKIIPGLYFAGEIIDGCASSGGYNLQQAFSTGFLAGKEASECVE